MRCVDLFSGCGGMTRGFIDAGYEVLAAFENWDAAIQCYEKNYRHPVYCQDLSEWQEAANIISGLGCDVIVGGPPCQDFSHAGQRIEGTRADLTVSFAEIVATAKPKYFVMENVERVRKSTAYGKARALLRQAGYCLTERVLNASYCGVPQNRKRFFSIGGLHQSDGFLDGVLAANLSELPTTVKDYLGDKSKLQYYYRHPRTYDRRGIFSVSEPAPTIRGSNRPLPPDYKKHSLDATEPTGEVRALTYLERAQIQTFPEDYLWMDSLTVNDQLIGNAVPVKLAYYIATCLERFDTKTHNSRDVGFVEWLKSQKDYTSRAAGDVLSRIRRIKRMSTACGEDLLEGEDIAEILEKSGCTKSVKSQLKRARALYMEYICSCK